MTTPQPLYAAGGPDDAALARRTAVSLPDAGTAPPRSRGLRARISDWRQEPGEQAGLRVDEEVLQLFYQVEALRTDRAPYVLQFVGVTPGAGVSTLAQGFAMAAALEFKSAVLLLDCRPRAGQQSVISALLETGSPDPALHAVNGVPYLFRAVLGDHRLGTPALPLSDVGEILNALQGRFSAVVLDCPPLESDGPLAALCRHCDGTLLVVHAERDRRKDVNSGLELLSRMGGVVLGTVLNRQKNHLPRWLDRLLG